MHTKSGKYSKDLPTRLAAAYLEARSDPELLMQRDEIGLLSARLLDVLKRVDTGESGELWAKAGKAWENLQDARAAGNTKEIADALNIIGDMIGRGQSDWAAWRDIRGILQERRSLVESERKRLVEMQQMITAEQAMVFMGAVVAAIRKHVTDRETLSAITIEFDRLTSIAGDKPDVLGVQGAATPCELANDTTNS